MKNEDLKNSPGFPKSAFKLFNLHVLSDEDHRNEKVTVTVSKIDTAAPFSRVGV